MQQHKCHYLSSLMQVTFPLNYLGDDKFQGMVILLNQTETKIQSKENVTHHTPQKEQTKYDRH